MRQLNGWINEGLRDKDLLESVAKFGAVATPGTPEDFRTFIGSEIKRWGSVVKEAGIKLD